MTSPWLFHGPSARGRAIETAEKAGRMLRSPLGDEGLKIADSRELAELLANTPLGDGVGTIVVGPMCRASSATTDVLLKTIEESDSTRIRPFFWAASSTEVSATIRSRCLLQWCPGEEAIDQPMLEAARSTLRASLAADIPGVLSGLKAAGVAPGSKEADTELFVRSLAQAFEERGVDRRSESTWVSLRGLMRTRDVTPLELLAALLPEECA